MQEHKEEAARQAGANRALAALRGQAPGGSGTLRVTAIPENRPSGLYTWLVSPEQEQQVCDALVNLGPVDTEQGLHIEGVRTIQGVSHCSLDDARAALRDLRSRKRIQETTAPNEPNGSLSPLAFRWVRPPR